MPIYTVGVSGRWEGHMIVEAPDADKAEELAGSLPVPANERMGGFADMTVDDVEERGEGDGLCSCRCGCAAKIAFEVARREPQLKSVTGALHLCDACLNNSRQKKQECALAAWMPEDEEV